MRQNRRLGQMAVSVGAILVTLGAGACGEPTGVNPGELRIETVPTRRHLISGGDALVRIEPIFGGSLPDVSVSVNGVDMTARFRPAPADWLGRESDALLGLVDGLAVGDNTVVVEHAGTPVSSMTVTNYPVTGPIFSGEHLEPYVCLEDLDLDREGQPRRFAIGNGDFLIGSALDDDCSLDTRVDYLYRTGGEGEGAFRGRVDPAELPADVAQTTTTSGATVPYVVRLETGTINRAIYQMAILIDPDQPDPTPWDRPSGWNGRLVYTYGGGCEAGFFQGTSAGGVLRDALLSKGYAVASSTLNVNRQGGCNDVLSAETTMMVKEHFSETFGPPIHTIGNGGSGGAMQQLLIAGAYPGILDGIMLTATFPDAVSYFIDTSQCRLPLRRFLNEADLDDETKRVVGGWATWETCDRSLGNRPNRIGPDDCPAEIPVEERYHPVNNPTGLRCSIYDGMRNVFGTRMYDEIEPAPRSAFGRSPHDNVGVQYGLTALNQGLISKELFLDLNEQVGGWDIDFGWRPERAEADPVAVRVAYETGRITSGGGGLATMPIIDERNYRDLAGDFHASYYSFITRERLIRDNGHADNYVLQRRTAPLSRAEENLALMDEWLTNVTLDSSGDDLAVKVVNAKVEALVEACWNADGNQIVEAQIFDTDRFFDNTEGRCNTLYPIHTGPRMVAGGPLTNDVLKCQLKLIDRADYTVEFSHAEWARLERIFEDGVCDWSKPGVGQVPNTETWLSFGPSPVNRYQPPPATTDVRPPQR